MEQPGLESSSLSNPSPFPHDALEANRAGRLTPAQRQAWRSGARGFRKAELQFALIITIIGLLVWFSNGTSLNAAFKPLIGVGCLILAGFLVVRSFLGADALTQDLRSGRVESVEGAITKSRFSSPGGNSASTYYLESGLPE